MNHELTEPFEVSRCSSLHFPTKIEALLISLRVPVFTMLKKHTKYAVPKHAEYVITKHRPCCHISTVHVPVSD